MGRRGKGRRMKRDPVPNDTNTQTHESALTYRVTLIHMEPVFVRKCWCGNTRLPMGRQLVGYYTLLDRQRCCAS
jgi:hypothetical protein